MISARITGLFRFLIGILLLQTATALITYTALMTDLDRTVWLFVALAGFLGLLVALWFDSVSGAFGKQAVARQHQRHSREREKLKLQAERERTKFAAQKQKKKPLSGSGLSTGVTVGGIVGIGVALMLAQFMTLGLLTIATAGSAAFGYRFRVRQERRARSRAADAAGGLLVEQGALPPPQDASTQTGKRSKRNPGKPITQPDPE